MLTYVESHPETPHSMRSLLRSGLEITPGILSLWCLQYSRTLYKVAVLTLGKGIIPLAPPSRTTSRRSVEMRHTSSSTGTIVLCQDMNCKTGVPATMSVCSPEGSRGACHEWGAVRVHQSPSANVWVSIQIVYFLGAPITVSDAASMS